MGIGGVGGYFGGKLAAYYKGSGEVEIVFIARGENRDAIRLYGLQIFTPKEHIIAHPALVSNNAGEIGKLHLLICCTKTYQLKEALENIRACIDENTILLPLLNGVDSMQIINALFPANQVWQGCVYVVSKLEKPGVIKKSGTGNALYFGSPEASTEALHKVVSILNVDGINAQVPADILQTVWEKFLFISTMATLTSYLDKSIGQILNNQAYKSLLVELLHELHNVTIAHGIQLPQNIIEQTLDKMAKFPFEATSSMHLDYQKGHKTELDSLTGYVVKLGKSLQVPLPTYEKIYHKLMALTP